MFAVYNKRFKHYSPTLGCSMTFYIYFPPSPSPSHKFPSVSAFAPIVNPVNCPWGQKAFTNYMGDKKAAWEGEDKFLHEQLQPQKFQEACRKLNVPLLMRMQPGYHTISSPLSSMTIFATMLKLLNCNN